MANPSIQLGTNSNWAVKEDKLLAYKEYNDYFFNKEFDFSRGTSATYVAKDGLIKTAGIQPNIVNNGDFSELGSELVTNGSFENWTADNPDSWTVLNEDANNYVTQDGTYARIVSNDTASIQIKQTIFTIGKIYKVELDAVVNSGNVEGLKLNDATAAATIGYVNSTGHHTFYFKAAGTAFVINRKGGGDTDISIDNVSVKQVDPNDYWTLGTGWSIGDNRATSDASTNSYLNQQVYEIGKTYKLGFEVLQGTIELRSAQYSKGTGFYTTGTYSIEVIPTTTSTHFYVYTGFGQSSITNITVQEIQTDTPRIDFTNDTKGHLLLEPQRSNVITYSEDFTQSVWTLYGAGTGVAPTVTANYAISPDGTQNATRLQFNLNGGTTTLDRSHIRYSSFSSQTDYYYSCYIKSANNENQKILWQHGGDSDEFTVTTEWQRVEFNRNGFAETFAGFSLRGGISTVDVSDVLIWGFQVEQGSYATSYIPTTGATSTRNADVCNNSGSAQDFNDSEGVLYAEIAALEPASSGSKFISISDGTYNNRASILFSNGATNQIRCFLRVGGVSQVDKSENITDATDFNKVAFSYKENEFKVFINGSQAGSTDTSGSVWSSGTITKLSLTEINSALGAFNGKVRNVQVFTEALTDSELQELTS